ncbi:hypothetical protein ACL9RF_17670, partial [Sphingobacterium sp. Mn56C]|uniref:hypothetical protein n=1 Tax=Sphingobacterium sp. Mn56C TaxID=3395261 RepID=UPI003BC77619
REASCFHPVAYHLQQHPSTPLYQDVQEKDAHHLTNVYLLYINKYNFLDVILQKTGLLTHNRV